MSMTKNCFIASLPLKVCSFQSDESSLLSTNRAILKMTGISGQYEILTNKECGLIGEIVHTFIELDWIRFAVAYVEKDFCFACLEGSWVRSGS